MKPGEIEFDWEKSCSIYKGTMLFESWLYTSVSEHHIPFEVFSAVTKRNGLVKLLVYKSNLLAQQNGRKFHTNEKEIFRSQLHNVY